MIADDIPPVSNLVIRHSGGAYACTGYVDRSGDHAVVHAVLLGAAHQPTMTTLTEDQLAEWEPGTLEDQVRQRLGWDGVSWADVHRVAGWLRSRYSGWYSRPMDAASLAPDWVDAAIDYLLHGDRAALHRI